VWCFQRAKTVTTVQRVSSCVNVLTLKDRATKSLERVDATPDTGVRDVISVSVSLVCHWFTRVTDLTVKKRKVPSRSRNVRSEDRDVSAD